MDTHTIATKGHRILHRMLEGLVSRCSLDSRIKDNDYEVEREFAHALRIRRGNIVSLRNSMSPSGTKDACPKGYRTDEGQTHG